jgi:DNA-binding response OmpR family regulator
VPEERPLEVIVVATDAALRAHARALLEADGYVVNEAGSAERLSDVARVARATAILSQPGEAPGVEAVLADLAMTRPDLDVLSAQGFGSALVDGGLERARVAQLARDGLFLLATVAEKAASAPSLVEKIVPAAELTAHRLMLSRTHVETVGAVATLACLGPHLGKIFGGGPAAAGVDGGLPRDLAAAVAAAETLRSPYPLALVLRAVEERWDGTGRPAGLAGDVIPIAARVVSVARDHARALAQKPDEAASMQALQAGSGKKYDPAVVDAFFKVLRDTKYLQRLEASPGGPRVAVVDGDSATLAMCELRLGAAGFSVTSYPDGKSAQDALLASNSPPAAVVSEIVVPRVDGLSLLMKLRRAPSFALVPVFFVSGSADPGTLAKALKMGATDVIAKPVNYDVLVAKLRAATSRHAEAVPAAAKSGVHGNLSEMPLTDVLQVCSFGRRTVTINVESHGRQGRLALERGEPVAAFSPDKTGRPAFYEITAWTEGTFSVEASVDVAERNLQGNLEALLLDALRKHDETKRKSRQVPG